MTPTRKRDDGHVIARFENSMSSMSAETGGMRPLVACALLLLASGMSWAGAAPEEEPPVVDAPAAEETDETTPAADPVTPADDTAAAETAPDDPAAADTADAPAADGGTAVDEATDDETPGEETTEDDVGAKPPPEPAVIKSRKVYEFVETITVGGLAQPLQVMSSQVIVVRRTGDVVSIELRPDAEGERASVEGEAPRGKIVVSNGGAEQPGDHTLEPATARFDFSREEDRELEENTGLHPVALRECMTILGQPRDANVFRSEGSSSYSLPLVVGGKPYTLKARQESGLMWVDWVLTEDGVISVGSEEVSLPLTFKIDDSVVTKRMRLGALAKMDYSTSLLGPESETEIETTLTFTGSGDPPLTYTRRSVLRPLQVADDAYATPPKDVPPAKRILAGAAFAGGAGAWSRSVTLALFGAQGLVGIRDTGLAMWLAQASIDTVAGREVARALAQDARTGVARMSKLTPAIGAPAKLLSDDVAGRSRYRVAAGFGQHTLDGMQVGALSFGESDGMSIYGSIMVMKRKSKKLFVGWGGKGTVVQSMESAERYWYAAGVVGKIEYDSPRLKFGLSAGPGIIYYLFQSPSGVIGADVMGILLEADLEVKLGGKLGLYYALDTSDDGGAVSTVGTSMGLRLYVRDSLAIQFGTSSVSLSDVEGSLGAVEQSDLGEGSFSVGVMARW